MDREKRKNIELWSSEKDISETNHMIILATTMMSGLCLKGDQAVQAIAHSDHSPFRCIREWKKLAT
jgi:hypothetical protein